MFLVHACWVMNMCIHFPHIIEVTMRSAFLSKKFSVRIKHQMKIEFLYGIQIISSKRTIIISKLINLWYILITNILQLKNITCSRRFSRWWHRVLIFPSAITRSMWCRSVKKVVASATGNSSSFAADRTAKHAEASKQMNTKPNIIVSRNHSSTNLSQSYNLYLRRHGWLHLASQNNAA